MNEDALAARDAIFIIGAARSGTTVLQNALNDARDVYLLGEPDLHLEGDRPEFAARYNAMHRAWRNQPTKSTFCPNLLKRDGPWHEHFAALFRHYRRVGSKIVINASWSREEYDRFCSFQVQKFYGAHYLLIFREPISTISSTQSLQKYGGVDVSSIRSLVANYMRVVTTFTQMVRTLPNVRAVLHEDMHEADWKELGDWLDVDCSGAAAYYDRPKPPVNRPRDLTAYENHLLDISASIHHELRVLAHEPIVRVQAEQNENQLSVDHFTPLGTLHRRAAMILADASDQG